MSQPNYLGRLWILYRKEWFRLKRNPAALMAAGLIVLMALLVSIENKASQIAKRQEALPCVVVYLADSPLIDHLKRSAPKKQVRFLHLHAERFSSAIRYPANMRCIAEITETTLADSLNIAVTNKAVDANSAQMAAFNRWLLTGMVNLNPKVQFSQQLKPLVSAQAAPKTMGKIDLASNEAKGMIGGMMLFSAQFFICCGLMISFTAYERERGILQSLAMTTTKPGEMLVAKLLFHVTLSILTSLLILKLTSGLPWWFFRLFLPVYVVIFFFSSMGFVAVATIIVSFNRHQSTASLVGFCYVMLMGVIFSLASKFYAFSVIKKLMFENYAISLFSGIVARNGGHHVLSLFSLMLFSSLLWLIAYLCFRLKGWKQT